MDEENIMVFIDVSSVPKLHKQSISNEIRLGGNVTLTHTIEIMNSVETTPGYEYCSYIAEHIERVANVPVRNVGHLALNTCTLYFRLRLLRTLDYELKKFNLKF